MHAPPFEHLLVWIDPQPRTGPENMAVDEWLLGHAAASGSVVLRTYRWLGPWVSFGYAFNESAARCHFSAPGLQFVRRWTGGGVVDHRADWTYTLAIPAAEPLAAMPAPHRYRLIHAALAGALQIEGIEARLSDGSAATASGACFRNPVAHDLVGPSGRKIAGAGQRRNRAGVLHQGSVDTAPAPPGADPQARACRFADHLGRAHSAGHLQPPPAALAALQQLRYGNPAWQLAGELSHARALPGPAAGR